MDDTMMKVRILLRAEMTLAQVHARVAARRTALAAVGLGLIVLTVGAVNVGLFHLTAERIGEAGAAFVIAGLNAVLGLGAFAVASRVKAGAEEKVVQEIRELALTELSHDAEEVKRRIDEVTADLQRIRTGVGALTSGGLGAVAGLGPLLGTLIDVLGASRGKG